MRQHAFLEMKLIKEDIKEIIKAETKLRSVPNTKRKEIGRAHV